MLSPAFPIFFPLFEDLYQYSFCFPFRRSVVCFDTAFFPRLFRPSLIVTHLPFHKKSISPFFLSTLIHATTRLLSSPRLFSLPLLAPVLFFFGLSPGRQWVGFPLLSVLSLTPYDATSLFAGPARFDFSLQLALLSLGPFFFFFEV